MATDEGRNNSWMAFLGDRRRLAVGCGLLLTLSVCVMGAFLALRQFRDPGPSRAPVVATEDQEGDAEATAVGPTPETGGDEPGAGRIVYVSAEGDLASIAPSGEGRRALGREGAMSFLFPAWSPDGSRVAALGAGASGGGVYVFDDEDGSEPTELYVSRSGAPIYLYWRPDSAAVSFIAAGPSGLDLLLSAVENFEDEPQLLTTGQPLYWDWFDEQERLIVHTGGPDGDGRITVVDAAGGTDVDEIESELADPGFFQAPVLSAGGQFAAFGEVEETRRWLTVRDLASQEQFRTAHVGAVAMSWSPSESRLAFISPSRSPRRGSDTYYGPLRMLDAASQDVMTLVDEQVLAFFWAPDGQRIAYFTLAQGMGEQVADADRGALRAALRSKGRGQHEAVRLSLSIVTVDGGDPQRIVDFQPPEIFLTQFLPFFDQYALSHRLWSPDSMALVLPIIEDERPHLYIVPATGRGLRLLADGQMGFWSPR